jgi:nucleotide-binding universal stress UspA family protein
VAGVHVVDQSNLSDLPEVAEVDITSDEVTEDALADLERLAAANDVRCETRTERGTPHEVIGATADRVDADLVTMGIYGRTGLDEILIGSVTDRMLRTSDVPVLATPNRSDTDSYDSVLVAVDGSDPATAAADHALAVASRFDATLHVLSAVYIRGMTGAKGVGGVITSAVENVTEHHENCVEDVAERAETHGVDTVTTVPTGMPSVLVREYVTEHDIDLVTMGTHGRSGLNRYLLGSVAERVVRTKCAPMMAVPP